jgi:hypothetical protein
MAGQRKSRLPLLANYRLFLARACQSSLQPNFDPHESITPGTKRTRVYSSFFLIAFLSEIVGTVAGFGSSVFFVPLASFFFDFHQVLALTSILHVFSNAAKLVFFAKHVRLRPLLLLGVPSVVAVIVGLPQHETYVQIRRTDSRLVSNCV